jgi:hypothetical protein
MGKHLMAVAVAIFTALPRTCSALRLGMRSDRGISPGTPSQAVGNPLVQIGGGNFNWTKKLTDVDMFLTMYANRPHKHNICGMRLSHSFAVWSIVRELEPDTIIESGINAGHSTYVIRAAAPHARIVSLDPADQPICGEHGRWIDGAHNVYFTGSNFRDFGAINWTAEFPDAGKTLAFFDDHQSAYDRIPILKKHGITYAIFEDNYANGEGDLNGDSLKQVLSQTGERANHLVDMITSYEEIPPLFYHLPQGMATRQRTCILGPTTKATFREPLIRPDSSLAGAQLLKKFEDRLGFEFGHDYEEFMMYCNIGLVTLA